MKKNSENILNSGRTTIKIGYNWKTVMGHATDHIKRGYHPCKVRPNTTLSLPTNVGLGKS